MIPKYFSKDTRDFLRLLAKKRVRYLIVGGEAVIYHGLARSTGDIDIFFEPSKANAKRLFHALKVFWGGSIPGIAKPEVLLEPRAVFQFGFPPNRLDVMSSISGVAFDDAWKTRVKDSFPAGEDKVPIAFIGLEALIRNKRSVSRDKDKEDLKYLEAAARKARP